MNSKYAIMYINEMTIRELFHIWEFVGNTCRRTIRIADDNQFLHYRYDKYCVGEHQTRPYIAVSN
jgi:hypothetical protein